MNPLLAPQEKPQGNRLFMTPMMGNELLRMRDVSGTGDMEAYQPTFRDRIGNAVYDAAIAMGLKQNAHTMRSDVQNTVDFVPLLGDAVAVDDASNALARGDYGRAVFDGVTGIAGLVPGGGDLLAGAMKAIIPIPAARALKTSRNLPDTDIFKKAVANTPGARIDDDGLSIPLTRNQRPEQAGQESVRGGVFYLPQGSKDAKYYTGTNHNFAYGGTDKIHGETLVSNPLFVKGATGGKAPEAAYDELMGKGAYQKMRTEVLNHAVVPSYIRDENLKAEQVSKFLEKYAPDLVGTEYEILANSKKGNQLAYALQEAAVASAARRAGHDAVIGYSVKRSTNEPFISELFDVRERTYPTPSGDYEVWPDFER